MFAVFPAPYVAAAGGGPTSLAFQDDAYSSGQTIDITGLTQAGDLIILSDFAFSTNGPPTLVTPADFTNWINIAGSFLRLAASYKIAAGDETTLTGMIGTGSHVEDKILAIFRPDNPISSITASTPTSEVTSGNPSAQNINADGDGTLPLIAFGLYANGALSAVDPRTMSPAATAELNGGVVNYHYLKYQIQNAALADVSIDEDDEGNDNMLAGGFLWAA
jgi:hypothetical protein